MGDLLEKYSGRFSPAELGPLQSQEPYANVEEETYDKLRNLILSGILPPGQRLLEAELDELVERIGNKKTNKTLIREALIRLAAESLVEYQPYKGFTVASFDLDELREIYFLRGVLEGAASQLACRNLTDEELDKLELLCQQMEKCLENNTLSQMSRLNTDFHETIYTSAKSPRLYKMITQLWNGFLHSSVSFLTLRAPTSVGEHKAIYEALRKRNPEEVDIRIKEHIASALEDLADYWGHRLTD